MKDYYKENTSEHLKRNFPVTLQDYNYFVEKILFSKTSGLLQSLEYETYLGNDSECKQILKKLKLIESCRKKIDKEIEEFIEKFERDFLDGEFLIKE